MTLTEWAWLALGAYAVHMIEEFMFDWRDWARAVIRVPVEWGDFYVTNSVVVVLGIVQGEVAATLPMAVATFAALMLINATFFHILPMIVTRGRWSPGVFTAVVLFYPVGIAIFAKLLATSGFTALHAALAFLYGALLMASPIVFLHLRGRSYFQQS
ncbi:MAG: HXXEE domain-containing protein [Bradyrhizobiaceae bacterium]|nr:MAG: HXXEE domain-containing protein [Bradyrhizobiaceae bacterium]